MRLEQLKIFDEKENEKHIAIVQLGLEKKTKWLLCLWKVSNETDKRF